MQKLYYLFFETPCINTLPRIEILPMCILLAGASHLKWNSANRDTLATTHDGDVRIWDLRVRDGVMEFL